MDTLLKHLIGITCQRDHALLDAAVITALHELAGASQVRVHELFRVRDDLHVRARYWLEDGKVAGDEEYCEQGGAPLVNFPALLAAISNHAECATAVGADGKHVLWVPIWLNDKVSSCLEIVDPKPNDANTERTLDSILSVYRNYQSILDYSERDSLTGLLNRKTFDERFSRLLEHCRTDSNPNSSGERRRSAHQEVRHWLGVLDIDHFKRVNDQFGHIYGDEVLILIANLLRQSFRTQDRVFRFGGEEFVVLLRSTTLDDARRIFDRFRANVEKHNFPQVGQVTISLGFASIANESPVVILGHADQALYYAKAHGRNRICYYDELVESGELRSEVSNDTVEFF
ncbi:MAG TPA: GGDEF domain-containing protein [Noviherbaspirillum sp.]